MPAIFDGSIGNDWHIDFGSRVTLSAGHGRGLIRNTGSLAMAFNAITVASPVAATITLTAGSQTGAAATAPIGTSAGLLTARFNNIAGGSAIAFPGRAYLGTSGATTGVTVSAGYTLTTGRLEQAGSLTFGSEAAPIILYPSGALAVSVTPSSQQTIPVQARCRVLGKEIAAIAVRPAP
jgi:hypothetical protein